MRHEGVVLIRQTILKDKSETEGRFEGEDEGGGTQKEEERKETENKRSECGPSVDLRKA